MLASILCSFFVCLANAVAFGGLTAVVTGGQIGTVEMIVATAGGGIAFALFSGQPLTILGGTGPIVIFTGLLYTVCPQLGLDFLAAYASVGVWSALLLISLSVVNASALMRFFTRFTDEIFAALVAVKFIVEAIAAILHPFKSEAPAVPDVFDTTMGRPWLANLFEFPTRAIFASVLPAVMATILLFPDQNITTRLVIAPARKLSNGPRVHLDLLIVGIITGGGAIFGLTSARPAKGHPTLGESNERKLHPR